MKVCFFGAYDRDYPRNAVIRHGLSRNGEDVVECRIRPAYKFWLRYPLLLSRFAQIGKAGDRRFQQKDSGPHVFFVPEFCHKDMPLAWFLAVLTSKKIVFDPLASRFETKIIDRRRKPRSSMNAWWNRLIDRVSLRLADLILADTHAHKDYYCLEFGVPPRKVEVLPVGFDDRIWGRASSAESYRAPDAFTVMFFGSFLPLHGVEVVVEAARIVAGLDASVRFCFVGSGQTFPAVRNKAEELGLKNVSFEGWLSQPELSRKVALEADVCLGVFGRTEKARRVVPHKVFQAMASAKPVITLRTPAAEEFFTHGENIWLCDRADPETLGRDILTLKRDETLRRELSRRGYELVREKYRPESLGRRLRDIMEHHFGRRNLEASP